MTSPADSSSGSPESGARDWPEDAAHENGQYENVCIFCLRKFVGHKRRVTCKTCVTNGWYV